MFEQGEATQVRVGVAQPGPADKALDLAVGEGGVGVVDGELDAFFEDHAQGEGVVLGFDRVDQTCGSISPSLRLVSVSRRVTGGLRL